MSFTLANTENLNKVFLLPRSTLLKRLDPAYYYEILNNKLEFTHPTTAIAKAVKSYTGGTPDKSKLEYWNGNTPWASPKDMKEFYLTDTEDKITEDAVLKSSTSIAPKGSVIIVFRSGILQHTLPVSITKIRTAINQDLKVLIPSPDLIPEYLAVYLKTFEKRILPRIVKHSTTVQSINQEEFNLLPIPVPSKTTQERVIRIYQQLVEQKKQNEAAAEKLLASIDDYLLKELGITLPTLPENVLKNRVYTASIKSISGNRFDPFFHQRYFSKVENAIASSKYPTDALRHQLSFIESGSRPQGGATKAEGGILSFGGEHVNNFCEVEVRTAKYISLEYHQSILSTETKLNDILFVKDGATTGKVGMITKQEHVGQNINEHVFLLRPIASINPVFLVNFLNSKSSQTLFKKLIAGATVMGITKDALKSLPVPIPPSEKQKEIVKHISELRQHAQQLKENTKEALKKASEEIEGILIWK